MHRIFVPEKQRISICEFILDPYFNGPREEIIKDIESWQKTRFGKCDNILVPNIFGQRRKCKSFIKFANEKSLILFMVRKLLKNFNFQIVRVKEAKKVFSSNNDFLVIRQCFFVRESSLNAQLEEERMRQRNRKVSLSCTDGSHLFFWANWQTVVTFFFSHQAYGHSWKISTHFLRKQKKRPSPNSKKKTQSKPQSSRPPQDKPPPKGGSSHPPLE